ncbi:MAG: hypothetical protein QM692_05435 [Thermomicrobiales bacterium]
MDPEGFDQMVMRMAAAPSRREALRGMGLGVLTAFGGAAGITLAVTTDEETAEAAKGKKKDRKGKNGGGDGGGGKGRSNGNDKHKGRNKKNRGKSDKDRDNEDEVDVAGADDGSEVGADTKKKKSAGKKCRKGRICLSNRCKGSKKKRKKNRGRCEPSKVGERCHTSRDCVSGSPCVNGICSFLS